MLEEPNNFNNDDMNDNVPEETAEEGAQPEESGNRTFLIVAGILGGLILLTLACVAVFIFYLNPRLSAQRNASKATIAANNAAQMAQMTSTAEAALWTPTSEPTLTPTNTAIPTLSKATNTPVVAVSQPTTSINTDTPELGAGSATLVFLQTQLAVQLTQTAAAKGTPTGALATTGFFDQVGLPGLIVLTAALLGVIFIARRMRAAPVK